VSFLEATLNIDIVRRLLVVLPILLAPAFGSAADFPKVYLSNGQIWIQASASQLPFQATHNGTDKSEPHVSPDGKLIVYGVHESLGEKQLSPLNIVLLDFEGEEVRRFKEVPMKKLANDICADGTVDWIDAGHVGVECDYNPSGGDYMVLNAVSGDVEKEFPGLYFSWSPDHQTLAYIGWTIHFATPASQNYCVHFNDRPVYTPGCSNKINATPKKARTVKDSSKDGSTTRGKAGTARLDSNHYENIHEVSFPLVWSPGGRDLAFVETIYDFDWGMTESGEETRETGNYRYYLAIVSTEHPAIGYRLVDQVGMPQLEWLNDSRVKLAGSLQNKPFERTFDLQVDPPRPIP